MKEILVIAILVAGIAQLVLCAASPFIPVVLKWPEHLRALPKLLRQVFWTYAAYILGAHLCFAAVSILAARAMLAGGPMAVAVSGFIALWWSARLVIHVCGFDTTEVPDTGWHRAAKRALGLLFTGLTAVYGTAVLFNLGIVT